MNQEFQEAVRLFQGDGVPKNERDAVAIFHRLAEEGHAPAQLYYGTALAAGQGVPKDSHQALRWITQSANLGHPGAQWLLGWTFVSGEGNPQDISKAVEWFTKSAEQGFAPAQFLLGIAYETGDGVPADVLQAHCWFNLAGAAGVEEARTRLATLESTMSREQISEAEQMAASFAPRQAITETTDVTPENIFNSRPLGHGTGFFITSDGFLVTNSHVVSQATEVRVNTGKGIKVAKVVHTSPEHDLALLKVEGEFDALPIASSSGAALGSTVATVGYPNIMLMGLSPKLAKGEIASLAGIQDDAVYFQISVPVQPGNSGGALVNESGNVIGVVSAKLSAEAAVATTGALPENVNYAVKSDYLLTLLDTTSAFTGKILKARSSNRKFQDIVKDAENASALILVY
jgi:S1-C subfamily serine protease